MADYYDPVTKVVTNYPPGVVPLTGVPVIATNVPPGLGSPITSNVPVQPKKAEADYSMWILGVLVFLGVMWFLNKKS